MSISSNTNPLLIADSRQLIVSTSSGSVEIWDLQERYIEKTLLT